MRASAGIMVIGTILYETIPALLLRIFSATDEMLAIGIPAFRIIGITAIISGMTIMMSGVFQAMNNSSKALIVSIVQAVTLVGSAALLALAHNTSLVWFAFPVSEIAIFLLSIVFLRGIHILLTEDNELNREIAVEVLNAYGFEADTAENGVIAVEKVVAAAPGQYDLILMDVQMHIMDGYTATHRIRELGNPALAGIPILAMTANAFDESRCKALESGMNGFLSKPIVIADLVQEMHKIL